MNFICVTVKVYKEMLHCSGFLVSLGYQIFDMSHFLQSGGGMSYHPIAFFLPQQRSILFSFKTAGVQHFDSRCILPFNGSSFCVRVTYADKNLVTNSRMHETVGSYAGKNWIFLKLRGCYIHKLQSQAYRDQNPISIITSLFKIVISCMGVCPSYRIFMNNYTWNWYKYFNL